MIFPYERVGAVHTTTLQNPTTTEGGLDPAGRDNFVMNSKSCIYTSIYSLLDSFKFDQMSYFSALQVQPC